MAQKISTYSVISIVDTVIESAQPHPTIGVAALDPYDVVLAQIDSYALDPTAEVEALDNTQVAPSGLNPFLTESHFFHRVVGTKTYLTIGPPGSAADFTGTTDAPFNAALAQLAGLSSLGGWLEVLPGTYTFGATLQLPQGIRLAGVHPGQVTLVTPGDYPVVQLADDCLVERLTLEGPALVGQPVVRMAGTRGRVQLCELQYSFLGCQMAGTGNWLRFCRLVGAAAGVWLQGRRQRVEYCSLQGPMAAGAIRIEGSESGLLGCRIDPATTGPSYQIVSPRCHDNQLVGCAFLSGAGLASASDHGTATVLFGNVPDTQQVNQNNMLAPLAAYTGQPTIASTSVTLSNTFTGTSTDLTSIVSALDLFVQNAYEERNWFIDSVDPTYDAEGTPVAGYWSWDGTTLTWPAFQIESVLARQGVWTVAAGSTTLSPGQAIYVEIDRSLAALDIPLTPLTAALPLPLVASTDAQRFVLAVGLAGGQALWLQGWRLLGGLTSFDGDGTPLPLSRYVGVEPRDPPPPHSGFAAEPETDLTTKLSAQSALLGQAYRRTNLRYSPESPDAEINTEPVAGQWAAPADVTVGLAGQTPTHLLQLRGSTYGLISTGLFRYRRDSRDWVVVAGCPLAGPFTALAPLGIGIGLLQVDGKVAHLDPETNLWFTYVPALPPSFTPYGAVRPPTLLPLGQADFSAQTPDYSLFTTLDGRTVRFSLTQLTLDEDSRVAGQVGTGFCGPDQVDTGYNVIRDPLTWFATGDNGFSSLGGLPTGQGARAKMLLGRHADLALLNWDSFTQEAFAYDPDSFAFLSVSTDGTSYYLLGGGVGPDGEARLLGRIGPTDLTDFQPHCWICEPGRQQVTVTGRRISTGAFCLMVGLYVGGQFTWSTSALGAANTCQGSVGGLDPVTGDLWVLVSNPARGLRPTVWRRSLDVWSQTTITDTFVVAGDTVVPQATANSFSYNHATDQIGAIFSYDPAALWFGYRDGSRAGRPTFLRRDRHTGLYQVTTLGEVGGTVTLPAATPTSFLQGLGGLFLTATQTHYWLTVSGPGQVTLISYRTAVGLWAAETIGLGGAQLSTTNLGGFAAKRTMTSLGCTAVSVQTTEPAAVDSIYFWTATGLYRGLMTTDLTGLVLNLQWSQVSTRTPLNGDVGGFSSAPRSTYGAWVGAGRGGTVSIQLVSRAEPQLPCRGAAQGADLGLRGLAWRDGGAKLVNPTANVWAGVNRVVGGKGYLWVGDADVSSLPVEWTPGLPPGDLVVQDLGGALDFDYAVDGAGNIAFCWVDQDNGNNLAFALYSGPIRILSVQQVGTVVMVSTASAHGLAATESIRIEGSTAQQVVGSWTVSTVIDTVTFTFMAPAVAPSLPTQTFTGTGGRLWAQPRLERGGFDNLAAATYPLASTPRIEWTTVAAAPFSGPGYNICAQLASNGQLIYFRRDLNGAWTVIRPGAGGNASYPAMTANRGHRPSRPLTLPNGDLVVATEDASQAGQLYNGMVSVRYGASATWATCFRSIGTNGFQYPWLAQTTGRFWLLGGGPGALVATATNPYPVSGGGDWGPFANPAATSYAACIQPIVYQLGDALAVTSLLAADGPVPAGREIGVWRFEASAVYAGAFTAHGRLQTAHYSGLEESYGSVGWTAAGQLLYGAVRPTQPSGVPHWGLRDSQNGWRGCGESLLGAGRFITVDRHFREQWVREPNQNLIVELDRSGLVGTWPNLPVAQWTQGSLLSCRWPFGTGASAPLFAVGPTAVSLVPVAGLTTTTWPQTAAARGWPLIVGTTALGTGPGPATFYQGAMLWLGPTPGTTAPGYFGAPVGAGGLLKNFTRPALTFLGQHRWRDADDPTRQFALVGPLTVLLDGSTVGSHLSFIFTSTGGGLAMDPAANPLTGWTNLDAAQDRFVVVVGELRGQAFQLYGGAMESYQENLTLGQLEPIELTAPAERWRYRAPTQRLPRSLVPRYDVTPLSAVDVQLRLVGGPAGIQRFTPGQLVARIGLPGGGHYLVGRSVAGPSRGAIVPIVTRWQTLIEWDE